MANRVAIIGVGQTYHTSKRPDVCIPELCNEAIRAALKDAELTIKDIDAVVTGNMELFEGRYHQDLWQVDYVGSYHKPGFRVTTGGTTGGTLACTAFFCSASGLFDVVMAVTFEKQSEGDSRAGLKTVADPLWDRWISTGAIGTFARLGTWYMKESGATEEHAALVRLKADRNACLNPHAHLKLHLNTVEDVLKSEMLVPPLRRLDMCPTSEGACAIIVASEKKAKKLSRKPVWVKDWVEVHNEMRYNRGDPVSLENLEKAALTIYKRNGITNPRHDISVAEIYEPSTWAELVWYEAFNFCDKGEAYKLIERGATNRDGEFPVNPSGGVIATNPIGATGMIRVAEAALQIRGDAGAHQVDREVKRTFTTAWGGSSWTVAHLLSKTLD